MMSSEYRIPASEAFFPEMPLEEEDMTEAPVLSDDQVDENPEKSVDIERREMCDYLLYLAERLADDSAPDRAAVKEQLFLFKVKMQRSTRDVHQRRITPNTARLSREQELPSNSALVEISTRKFPDFDFSGIRDFLAQHATSRYTVALLRALVHHSTWKFLEISDRRAFVLALVAFDIFRGGLANVAERGPEIFLALVNVLACEWAGRVYLAKFPLLVVVQIFVRAAIDSPVFIQGLAAIQRLSYNPEISRFFLDCQLHEYLLMNVLACEMHSEFACEFALGVLVNLADLPDFTVSEAGMAVLKRLLRHSEFAVDLFAKILKLAMLKDVAFAVGVDAELEAGDGENFRLLLDLLHGPSREASAEKLRDSPTLGFLEEEELAQLAIGRNLAKETFITKRFQGMSDEDRAFFADFLSAASQGRLLTARQVPKVGRKPKKWR